VCPKWSPISSARKPSDGRIRAQRGGFRSQGGGFWSQRGGFGSQRGGFGSHRVVSGHNPRRAIRGNLKRKTYLWVTPGKIRAQKGGFRSQRGGFRSQRGGFGSQGGGFGSQGGGFGSHPRACPKTPLSENWGHEGWFRGTVKNTKRKWFLHSLICVPEMEKNTYWVTRGISVTPKSQAWMICGTSRHPNLQDARWCRMMQPHAI
jgi:hypothetical protein